MTKYPQGGTPKLQPATVQAPPPMKSFGRVVSTGISQLQWLRERGKGSNTFTSWVKQHQLDAKDLTAALDDAAGLPTGYTTERAFWTAVPDGCLSHNVIRACRAAAADPALQQQQRVEAPGAALLCPCQAAGGTQRRATCRRHRPRLPLRVCCHKGTLCVCRKGTL